jgi:precorrin-6B methylase 2
VKIDEARRAMASLERSIEARPGNAGLHTQLGILLCELERFGPALPHFERAAALAPHDAGARNNLGTALKELGRHAEALPQLELAVTLKPDYPEALNNLGIVLAALGRYREAAERSRAALELRPGYAKALRNLRLVYQEQVPLWHFPMMNDARRNAAFDAAIRHAVKPGMRVLDIGSGSGLLAMMAARAGAGSVFTCEMVPLIADKAREIVCRNGLDGVVTVIGKRSTELAIGEDMPGRADLLITETFDAGLLGEGALPAIEHACLELLTPAARILPRSATVTGMLVESAGLQRKGWVGDAAGFDLSAFNEYRPASFQQQLSLGPGCRPLSADFDLFTFDFQAGPIAPAERVLEIGVTADGVCHAAVFWHRLELDGARCIETAPDSGDSHWKQIVQLFVPPLELRAGQTLELTAAHDRLTISLRL